MTFKNVRTSMKISILNTHYRYHIRINTKIKTSIIFFHQRLRCLTIKKQFALGWPCFSTSMHVTVGGCRGSFEHVPKSILFHKLVLYQTYICSRCYVQIYVFTAPHRVLLLSIHFAIILMICNEW